MKNKIQLSDSITEILFKVSEGNPGALNVCVKALETANKIDPDSAMGGIGSILALDSMGVYGSKIWMLYKDVCGQDISRFLAVLRGRQLGFVSESSLVGAIENRGNGIDVEDICSKVCKRLPSFKLLAATQESI